MLRILYLDTTFMLPRRSIRKGRAEMPYPFYFLLIRMGDVYG